MPRACSSSKIFSAAFSSLKSLTRTCAATPFFSQSAATARSALSLRATRIRSCPPCANNLARSTPIPLDAPVTNATGLLASFMAPLWRVHFDLFSHRGQACRLITGLIGNGHSHRRPAAHRLLEFHRDGGAPAVDPYFAFTER